MDTREYFDVSKIKGKYQKAVAEKTAEVLRIFCADEPEFEQAVEQSGKTYQECLNEATKGLDKSISDEDFFTRAVQFYFPGATVRSRPYLDLTGQASEPELSGFDSLLDF